MNRREGNYQFDDDIRRVDFAAVTRWLASTYWSPGIAREAVERAARYSAVVVGAYRDDGTQVGFARVVSDRTAFAWVADVFVDESARRQGVARGMVRFLQTHPELQGLRRWMLATRDAQPVYAGLGFKIVDRPELLMYWRPDGSEGMGITPKPPAGG